LRKLAFQLPDLVLEVGALLGEPLDFFLVCRLVLLTPELCLLLLQLLDDELLLLYA
jgi:hypothetical protein